MWLHGISVSSCHHRPLSDGLQLTVGQKEVTGTQHDTARQQRPARSVDQPLQLLCAASACVCHARVCVCGAGSAKKHGCVPIPIRLRRVLRSGETKFGEALLIATANSAASYSILIFKWIDYVVDEKSKPSSEEEQGEFPTHRPCIVPCLRHD